MKEAAKRSILRWIHIIISIPIRCRYKLTLFRSINK